MFLCVLEVNSKTVFSSAELYSQKPEIKEFNGDKFKMILSEGEDDYTKNGYFTFDYIRNYRSSSTFLNQFTACKIQYLVILKQNKNEIIAQEERFRIIDQKGIYLQHYF